MFCLADAIVCQNVGAPRPSIPAAHPDFPVSFHPNLASRPSPDRGQIANHAPPLLPSPPPRASPLSTITAPHQRPRQPGLRRRPPTTSSRRHRRTRVLPSMASSRAPSLQCPTPRPSPSLLASLTHRRQGPSRTAATVVGVIRRGARELLAAESVPSQPQPHCDLLAHADAFRPRIPCISNPA